MYTRVTVKASVKQVWRKAPRLTYHLEAERVSEANGYVGANRVYQIRTKYDSNTGALELLKNELCRWEIENYGIVNYHGDFKVTNLVMDNNPPYKVGMKGIVQILWTGTCIYDSAED